MFIEKITVDGIQYIDNSGVNIFLSLNKCNENWLSYRKRTDLLNDEQVAELRGKDRTIGQRDIDTAKKILLNFLPAHLLDLNLVTSIN